MDHDREGTAEVLVVIVRSRPTTIRPLWLVQVPELRGHTLSKIFANEKRLRTVRLMSGVDHLSLR